MTSAYLKMVSYCCCHFRYVAVVTLQNSGRVVNVSLAVAVAAVAASDVDLVVVLYLFCADVWTIVCYPCCKFLYLVSRHFGGRFKRKDQRSKRGLPIQTLAFSTHHPSIFASSWAYFAVNRSLQELFFVFNFNCDLRQSPCPLLGKISMLPFCPVVFLVVRRSGWRTIL